jgi:hypothetical protein
MVELINWDPVERIYFLTGRGTAPATPVAAAKGTRVVAPGGVVAIDNSSTSDLVIRLIGNGNAYSVVGV